MIFFFQSTKINNVFPQNTRVRKLLRSWDENLVKARGEAKEAQGTNTRLLAQAQTFRDGIAKASSRKLARYFVACTKSVHPLFFSRPNRANKLTVV